MAKTNTETARADVILNGQKANATLKEIEAAARAVNAEMRKLPVNSQEFIKKSEEFKKIKNHLTEVKGEVNATGMSIGKMAQGFNKYFAMGTAMVASLTGLIFSFRKVIDVYNQYEKKLDNLSALTGLTGEKLNWLSDQAKAMSVGMVEGNIRITQSADAIVDAYTKVGSARPELLKNKEELNMVTQEAIILSEAANSELQPAVEALTGMLNQFNAPASDSRRIINALAAGSKEGAGEVPYLTTAIEKAGTVAADCNISYEELIGTIETLAPRISQPEIAGRSLRAVILKLQESADDTNPAVVGFTQAIENLGKKNLPVTKLMKLFGIENITVGKILINNIGELKKYTEAVTGTSVALEQAAINTDNNTSKLDQARNKVQLYSIELGQKLAPALTFSTNAFSYLMKAILGSISFFNQHRAGVLAALAAVAAYTVVVYGATVATKSWTIATELLNKAWKALIATTKGNVFGLIAAGVAAAATYLLLYKKTVDETAKSQQHLIDLKKSFNDKVNDEKVGLDLLYNALKKTNSGSRERQELIDTINQRYGTTLQNIKDEKAFLDQLNTTYDDLIINMQKKALMESKEEPLKEAYKARQEVLDKIRTFDENLKKQDIQVEINLVTDPNLAKGMKQQEKAWEGITAGADQYREELEAIEKKIKDIKNFSPQDLSIINSGSGTKDTPPPTKPTAVDEKKLEKAFEQLYNVRKSLNIATIDEIIDYEKKKLEEQKVWERLSLKEQEIWELALRKEYLDKQNALKKERNEKGGTLGFEKLDNKTTSTGEYFTSEKRMGAPIGSVTGPEITGGGIEKDTQYWAAKANNVIGYAQTVFSQLGAINDMMSQNEDAQLARDEAINDAKKDNLKKQLDGKVITQKQYDASVAKMDAEMEKKKRKLVHDQAVRQKEISLVQAVINTAQAVTSALTAGPIIGEVLAVLVGALGAVQIGMIASQEVPQAKKGKYNVIGEDDGKLYSDVPYAGKAETGIYNGPTLVAEDGPELIVDAPTTKNIKMNYPEILQAIQHARVPQHASGNVTPLSPGGRSADAVSLSKMIDILNKNMEEGNRINDQLRNELKRGIVADISFEKLRETTDKINSIESDVTK